MATSYTKIWNEDVIEVLTNNVRDEFGPSFPVYTGNEYKREGNYSIRVGIVNQVFNEINDNKFLNTYNLEIKIYSIVNVKTDLTYKDFFHTLHRLEQVVQAYQGITDFLDFKVTSITLNDFEDKEEDVNGLQTATIFISFSLLNG